MAEVVASAPGKVLMTGGYLILEKPNSGIILSTDARFYAIVKPLCDEIHPESWSWSWTDLKLKSPQLSRETVYKLSLKNLSLQCLSSSETRNPYVEQAVQYAVAAARVNASEENRNALNELLLQGLDVTILGDNAFYSYRNQIESRGLPLHPDSLAALPKFTSITFNSDDSNGPNCKPEVAKTGLGSSAAMTTAVVAALLQYFKAINLSPQSDKNEANDLELVHMIAQTAHCIAQGKVGSGFDVSSAVYGTHKYVRFSPEVISPALAIPTSKIEEAALSILNGNWDNERVQFKLPPLMSLVLGEPGTGGSSTPSMVGAVNKWRKEEPEKYLETWEELAEGNAELETQFRVLNSLAENEWETYRSVVKSCSLLPHKKWSEEASDPKRELVVKALTDARDAMVRIRTHMRYMGESAGVPIEPESQTQLLDETMETEGVLLAGIPGAGGFDAVFAIIISDEHSKLNEKWVSLKVLPLVVKEDPRGASLELTKP